MPAPCARAWQPACGTLRRIAPNPRRCRAIRARAHRIVGSENRAERRKLRAKEPPDCSATRPEAADFGRTSPVHAKGLAKIRGFREARCRQTDELPGQPDYADPPLRRVLRF